MRGRRSHLLIKHEFWDSYWSFPNDSSVFGRYVTKNEALKDFETYQGLVEKNGQGYCGQVSWKIYCNYWEDFAEYMISEKLK